MNIARVSYNDIKDSFMRCYYIYCQNKIHAFNRRGDCWVENEWEFGFAHEQLENAYDLAIENLMLEVFTLIMMAGRAAKHIEKNYRNNVADILSKHNLDELFVDISEEEKKDLLYDMRLLRLIDEKN